MKAKLIIDHRDNSKTVTFLGGHVREIFYGEEYTTVLFWSNELDIDNYVSGNTLGKKGKAKVFKGRKCVFIGTVKELDDLEEIGTF